MVSELDNAEVRYVKLKEFNQLSLAMYQHTEGQNFEQAMQTFPSEAFHRWCELGRFLTEAYGRWKP